MTRPFKETARQKRQITYDEQVNEKALGKLAKDLHATPKAANRHKHPDRTILRGRVSSDAYSSSLNIHVSDNIEVEDYTVEATVKPALTVSLILNGQVEGSIGDKNFYFSADEGPAGYLWSLSKKTPWSRDIKKETHVRKVIISANHDWLIDQLSGNDRNDQALIDFVNNPLQIIKWTPSRRVIAIAEQLINPSKQSSFLTKLFMESRALEIIGEALECILLSDKQTKPSHLQSKAQQIRSYIEQHIHDDLTLKNIAKELGGSINSLQRIFKTANDMTIMDYIRERRLILARDAMVRDGITIAQAAYLAGYNSPANFSTAFKRAFGLSPSNLKN